MVALTPVMTLISVAAIRPSIMRLSSLCRTTRITLSHRRQREPVPRSQLAVAR
jgi:hypothetical protein